MTRRSRQPDEQPVVQVVQNDAFSLASRNSIDRLSTTSKDS